MLLLFLSAQAAGRYHLIANVETSGLGRSAQHRVSFVLEVRGGDKTRWQGQKIPRAPRPGGETALQRARTKVLRM